MQVGDRAGCMLLQEPFCQCKLAVASFGQPTGCRPCAAEDGHLAPSRANTVHTMIVHIRNALVLQIGMDGLQRVLGPSRA